MAQATVAPGDPPLVVSTMALDQSVPTCCAMMPTWESSVRFKYSPTQSEHLQSLGAEYPNRTWEWI